MKTQLAAGALALAAVLLLAWSTLAGSSAWPRIGAVPAQAQSEAALVALQAPTRLNLNTATREQFLTIPNVGDRMVREFFEYRPYVSIVQFRREIGKYVSAEQVTAYEQYVYVPVSPNDADAQTLQQLPGVDDAVAAQLIAGRPYASPDDFVARLAQSVTADQAAAARAMLATP